MLVHLFHEAGEHFKTDHEVDPSQLSEWMALTEALMAMQKLKPGDEADASEGQKHEVEAHVQARA